MSNKRPDSKYQIESVSKALAVLEALEGRNFEPVSVQKIMERTGFNRDTVDRNLKNFRLRGYAIQNERGEWSIGKRLIALSLRISNL